MKSLVVVALVLLLSLSAVVEGRKWRPYTNPHRFSELYLENYHRAHPDEQPFSFQLFDQKVDHFNEQDRDVWSQRYLVNEQFWNGTGPIFFMISGEGPMDPDTVTGFQYVVWAQQFNALIVALEHRFYGESQPTADLSLASLQLLSSEQALADSANFISFIIQQYKAQNNLVIVFGGSYAGMLSGWMRQKYPNLVGGSIASSGPVFAEVDFYQYLDVVTASLTTIGSAQCVANIAAATQQIQPLTTTTDGLNKLSAMLNTCAPITPADIPNVMQSLAGNFMDTVQYNQEIPQLPTISQLCTIMTNTSNDPLTNYLSIWNEFAGGECADVSYADMITELKSENLFIGVGGRQWFYQTCVEFGFFQTSTSTSQPFGNLFNVTSQTKECTDVFGFDFLPDVNWTLTEFGGRDPDGSSTLWVNGVIDPWHSLGVLSAQASDPYNVLIIPGTAHCADMMVPFAGSPPTLAPAQGAIRAQLASWIARGKEK